MGRQRVCFVSIQGYGYFNPDVAYTGGGAERQLYLVGTELADELDVHFIVGDYGQPPVEQREGVTLHRAFDPTAGMDLRTKAEMFGQLVSRLRDIDPDVLVTRDSPDFATVLFTIADLLGVPWVYDLANDANIRKRPAALSAPRRRLFERGVERAGAVVAQTDAQATLFERAYQFSPTVIPNGYPAAETTRPHDERDAVIWVGRLDEAQKRPHRCLDIASSLPAVPFSLIGPSGDDATYQQELERRASALDNVTLTGAVRPDRIHRYFRNAIALINTSAYEGFPNTFLEAWRVETPVLCLDIDPSRFVDGELPGAAGGDLTELTSLVDSLAADVARRRELGRLSRRAFARQFDIDTVAAEYARVLRQVATEPGNRTLAARLTRAE